MQDNYNSKYCYFVAKSFISFRIKFIIAVVDPPPGGAQKSLLAILAGSPGAKDLTQISHMHSMHPTHTVLSL